MQLATPQIPIGGKIERAAGHHAHIGVVGGHLDAHAERGRVNFHWLIQLHWWAILGQVLVIVAAEAWTTMGLPVWTLGGLLALEVLGIVALSAWARRVQVSDASIAAVMFLDVVVLTVLLDLTGGASNPFSTLYLVNVALAAVLLPQRWSWGLTASSLVAFGSLFVHEALAGPGHHVHWDLDHEHMMTAHLRGMWVAFALAAVFIVFFVQRVSRALAARERELRQARAQAERREKLASLATLAAGAAHELSTPLSTIAIVAKELQRSLSSTGASAEVRSDLQLVRDQVARCRDILDRMAAHAGENVGEPLAPVAVRSWIEASLEGLSGRDRVDVEAVDPDAELVGPPRALSDALRGMLKNALQASPPGGRVTLRVSALGGRIRATVLDRGRGMPPDVLARVGEPFFTTKGPGEGMGLGLFLTRALAEQLDGAFHIAPRAGGGTEAWLELPAAGAAERSAS
jgi:two-component system sensor histidine kinase RegB